MWKLNCFQVANFDEAIVAKDTEIEWLSARVAELEAIAARDPDVDSSLLTHIYSLTHYIRVPASVPGSNGQVSLTAEVPVTPTPTR